MISEKSNTRSQEYSESILNTVHEPFIVLDQDLRVASASRSFYDFFKVNPEETVGQLIYDLGNKQWDIPKLRELLETILPQQTTFDDYEVEHDFATIGRRTMLLNARQIEQVWGKERIILLAIEDITERKHIEMEKEKLIAELKIALDEVKTLRGIIPICAYCKKIRDDKGAWDIIEAYICERTDAEFSHGICPDCHKKVMKELELDD